MVLQGSTASPVMETNAKTMFSVKHLLDMRHQKNTTWHLQQDQRFDDVGVSHMHAEGVSPSQIASVADDDPLRLIGTPAGACLVAGGETSLSASPSRYGTYADMPDVVPGSTTTSSCYDQDNPYIRLLQSNASSPTYYTGINLQLINMNVNIKRLICPKQLQYSRCT